jgi:AcrR family transcriptional regulator
MLLAPVVGRPSVGCDDLGLLRRQGSRQRRVVVVVTSTDRSDRSTELPTSGASPQSSFAAVGEHQDADAAVVSGQLPVTARVPLSRDRILAAAVSLIDEHGVTHLTMRRLGTDLHVEAMSMYRYVASREELLDGVVETLVAELSTDPDVVHVPDHGWQDFLQRLAHGIRRVALRHPKAFPLVASRPPEAPWLRPPLRSLEWVERFLDGLVREGFAEPDAVGAYRAFTSFLLGHLLLEVSVRGADIGPLDEMDSEQDTGEHPEDPEEDLLPYPLVRALKHALADDQSAVEFEESLENLLERVELMRST